MTPEQLSLPTDPDAAIELIREASRSRPVVLFKKSPICPVSTSVEVEFRDWLAGRDPTILAVAEVDVIGSRRLARGLTTALGIRHESPQALVFAGGELTWHGSHEQITASRLEAAVSTPGAP